MTESERVRFDRELGRLDGGRPPGTFGDLLARTLPPVRWVVDGLIPEGLTLLGGKPKLGKSFLALAIGLAVCGGRSVLGFPTRRGEVLYIALEDGERRLQDRARTLGATELGNDLDRFHYRCDWHTLDRGGLDDLEQWMVEHPTTTLIVVDTLGRIRGNLPGKDRYSEEYGLLGELQSFALRHHVALVLVHHLRKQAAADWLETLSGSQAVGGAADTLLVLFRDRGRADATLKAVSRDADELDLALRFDGGRWEVLGEGDEYRLTPERAEIVEAIRRLGGTAAVKDIATEVGKSVAAISKLAVRLAADHLVRSPAFGVYSLNTPIEVVEAGEVQSANQPQLQPLQLHQPTPLRESSP